MNDQTPTPEPPAKPCRVEMVDRTDSVIGPPFLHYAKCECGFVGPLREIRDYAEGDAHRHECAPPPAPEPPAEVDPDADADVCAFCLDIYCTGVSCLEDLDANDPADQGHIEHVQRLARWGRAALAALAAPDEWCGEWEADAPPAPEPPAEVDPWEHLRHTISCRTAWCKTCHAAVAALDAHDAEADR